MTRKYIDEKMFDIANRCAKFGFAVGSGEGRKVTDPMAQDAVAHIKAFGDEIEKAIKEKNTKALGMEW